MKKNILFLIGFLFSASVIAAPISKDAAKKKALTFLNSTKKNGMKFATASLKSVPLQLKQVEGSQAYYVFNIGNKAGYVIVSGDDRAEEILGYVDSGSFDQNKIPQNMKFWLEGYQKELETLATGEADAENDIRPIRQAIPALITTRWNQTKPYSNKCPKFDGDTEERPTGCVATAMAQVMYYHKWPQGKMKKGINRYTYIDEVDYGGDGSERQIPYSPATTFDWDNMLDVYQPGQYTEENADAVAKLMMYCGRATQMNYWPQMSGSLSHDIPLALRQYFDYDSSVRILNRYGYMTTDWEDIIYEELSNARPILYSGASDNSGHQFVCDGYENGFFHINWGWGGMSDGYFKLSALNPSIHGVGGAGNGMNFAQDQWAIIGIQKNVGGAMPEPKIALQSLTYYYDMEEEGTDVEEGRYVFDNDVAKIKLNAHFGLSFEKSAYHATAIALYDEQGNFIRTIAENNNALFIAGASNLDLDMNGVYDQDIKKAVKFTREDFPSDGSYYVKAFYKLNANDTEWIPAMNSENNFVRLDVNKDTIQAVNFPEVSFTFTDIEIKGNLSHDGMAVISGTIHNHGAEVNGVVTPAFYGIDMGTPHVPVYLKENGRERVELSIKFTPYAEELDKYFEGKIPVGIALNGKPSDEYKLVSLNKTQYVPADLDFEQTEMTDDGVHVCGGDFIEIPLKVTNNSKEYDFANMVRLLIIQVDKQTGTPYIYRQTEHFVSVPKDSQKEVTLKVEDVDMDAAYTFFLFYENNGQLELYGGQEADGTPKKVFMLYVTVDAAKCWNSTGEKFCSRINADNVLTISNDVCFVEMPKDIEGLKYTLNPNPNTVYKFYNGQKIPAAFNGKNIVVDDMGKEINIVEGNDYYVPYGIYADEATYTCVAKRGAQGLYVPFKINSVQNNGQNLRIADNDEGESDISILSYVAESPECVYFDYTSVLPDASPVIYMADAAFEGQDLVFTGNDVMLVSSNDVIAYGDYYDFHGCANNLDMGTGYGFGGDKFYKTENVRPGSFGVYLTPVGSDSPAEVKISLPEKVVNDIENVSAEDSVYNVYNTLGVIVKKAANKKSAIENLPTGVYIINGKKFIK